MTNAEPAVAFRRWYLERRPIHRGLADTVRSTMENLLRHSRIPYLAVSSRVKTLSSCVEKIGRKSYAEPAAEITDIVGVRIITFIETDVDRACRVITESFETVPAASSDKLEALGVDRFGYRSIHFVCDLGPSRLALPEFALYAGCVFEVQVRTVLQHAWAEIEHDRSYKFSGVLPTPLNRRLHAIAGMLEIADREFASIAAEVDAWQEEVETKTEKGDLEIELTSASLVEYVKRYSKTLPSLTGSIDGQAEAIEELRLFGILTVDAFHELVQQHHALLVLNTGQTLLGLVRSVMLLSDMNRYFKVAWRRSWQGLHQQTEAILIERYGAERVKKVVDSLNLHIIPDDV